MVFLTALIALDDRALREKKVHQIRDTSLKFLRARWYLILSAETMESDRDEIARARRIVVLHRLSPRVKKDGVLIKADPLPVKRWRSLSI